MHGGEPAQSGLLAPYPRPSAPCMAQAAGELRGRVARSGSELTASPPTPPAPRPCRSLISAQLAPGSTAEPMPLTSALGRTLRKPGPGNRGLELQNACLWPESHFGLLYVGTPPQLYDPWCSSPGNWGDNGPQIPSGGYVYSIQLRQKV